MINCLIVGLGGFLGSVCRYLVGLIPLKETTLFPFRTLCINVLGSLAIGMIAAAAGKGRMDPRMVLFLKVGLCGGFTTFSTFALESLGLLEKGRGVMAVLYVVISVSLGVLAAFFGEHLPG